MEINRKISEDLHTMEILTAIKPFVVEVFGTPNSGKSTAIRELEKTLKDKKIKYKIIYEVASQCGIKNKLSLEFNLWTLNETLKQLIETVSGDYDIVICERGLIDTICWCELYLQNNLMTSDEYRKIVDYILLERFVGQIKCEFIFKCSDKTSLQREKNNGANGIMGTIKNENVLSKYNSCLDRIIEKYGDVFKSIVVIDTDNLSQKAINEIFISKIFECANNI